eukprot:CAMPEP_0114623656 /NCGR_PEP_ID=MMETSP0168-20121206/10366_1 /TAXON_ID=95228 ORGANISM="Vannella sp., Strain DIVA3 517/6/12" /NCGR_SAMPLE_ID=MMETSP0168 /ASSEMBLY_ACC=CAM_ASM_000044 /LENGTH=381 /DNA_ID=CAMNT_0001834911 /DNA_START=64 /DNA_END=1209 /DNA_ORIENTATION=-
MEEQLHRMCKELPKDVHVASVEQFAEEHGIVSKLYKVTLSAGGDHEDNWNGLQLCVKWYDAALLSNQSEEEALREVRMYQEIAPGLKEKIHLVHCYGCERVKGMVMCMAFEYIRPPFVLGQQVKGIDLDEALALVQVVARYHSAAKAETLPPWVKHVGEAYFEPLTGYVRENVPEVTVEKIEALVPEVEASPALKALQQMAGDGVVERLARGLGGDGFEDVLLHMDVRGSNYFLRREEGTEKVKEIILIDWQNLGYGPGIIDLVYCISSNLPVTLRREHERQLVRAYVQEYQLLTGRTEPSEEEYWQRYRMGLAWPLCWAGAVCRDVEKVLDSVKKTDPVLRESVREFLICMTRRHLAAAVDHDAPSLLAAHLSKREASNE